MPASVERETHYVLTFTVERVDKVLSATNERGYSDRDLPATPGEVTITELASVTIKDRTLAGVKGRSAQHIDLVEDL